METKDIIRNIIEIKYNNPEKPLVVLATHDILQQIADDNLTKYEKEMLFGYHYTICGLPAKEINGVGEVFVSFDLRFYR